MERDTKILIDATRAVAKILQRDFFELENLQSSRDGNANFISKSYGKAYRAINNSLSKYYNTILFDDTLLVGSSDSGHIALVNVIDGLENFKRSLPYFSTIIVIISKKNGILSTERVVINFPILGEVYFAEKGKGAWFQNFMSNITGITRARVSGFSRISDMIVLSSSIKLIEDAQSIASNVRVFESNTYSLAQVIRGKIDIMITTVATESIILPGVELFIKEAGGTSGMINDMLIVSNFRLYEKVYNLVSLKYKG